MARLASQAKMGYYATPPETLRLLKDKIEADHYHSTMIDPCCGKGEAVYEVATKVKNHDKIYGIELDGVRANESFEWLGVKTLCGSIYDAVVRPLECFSLLYLNPPYEYEKGERLEFLFLKHSQKWLIPGGILVFLIPEHILNVEKISKWIARRYEDIRVYRFTREEYPRFRQVALFGVKKHDEDETVSKMPTVYPHIEDTEGDYVYRVPRGRIPDVFEMKGITETEIAGMREDSIRNLRKAFLEFKDETGNILSPIFPLRKGHLLSILMSGVLNGRLNDDVLFKCFTQRTSASHEIEESGKTKVITVDSYQSGIRVIERSQWYDVT